MTAATVSERPRPAESENVRVEVIAAEDLFDVVRPLEINRERTRFREGVGNGARGHRPADRSGNRWFTAYLSDASGPEVISAELDAQVGRKSRFESTLPYAIDGLISPYGLEWRDAPQKRD